MTRLDHLVALAAPAAGSLSAVIKKPSDAESIVPGAAALATALLTELEARAMQSSASSPAADAPEHIWSETDIASHGAAIRLHMDRVDMLLFGLERTNRELLAALEEARTDLVVLRGNVAHAEKTDTRWEGTADIIGSRIKCIDAAVANAGGQK